MTQVTKRPTDALFAQNQTSKRPPVIQIFFAVKVNAWLRQSVWLRPQFLRPKRTSSHQFRLWTVDHTEQSVQLNVDVTELPSQCPYQSTQLRTTSDIELQLRRTRFHFGTLRHILHIRLDTSVTGTLSSRIAGT